MALQNNASTNSNNLVVVLEMSVTCFDVNTLLKEALDFYSEESYVWNKEHSDNV